MKNIPVKLPGTETLLGYVVSEPFIDYTLICPEISVIVQVGLTFRKFPIKGLEATYEH